MKRYRIVLLPLLAALLCTVLAGCSKQNNQPQDSGTGQDSATEEPLQTLTVASDGSTEMTLWLAKSLWVSAPEVREHWRFIIVFIRFTRFTKLSPKMKTRAKQVQIKPLIYS